MLCSSSFLLFVLIFFVACDSGKPSSGTDIQWDFDLVVDGEKSDSDENLLPDLDEEKDDDGDGEKDEKDISDIKDYEEFDGDVAVVDEFLTDDDALIDDGDLLLEPCFEKACASHGECSVAEEACAPYLSTEAYACGPKVEDFGYRGSGTCLEVNCSEDADCREDLGYICLQFGAPSAEFNGASSACLRSLSGAPCDEEGKKVCQFGKNIAITCTDGVWKPYFCEEDTVCTGGECLPETTDSDALMPDADVPPPVEICDGVDNNGNTQIDEGCDDDGDGWCDITMPVYGQPPICPNGVLDCDDEDPNIYPGSTIHQEGKDYDCDNRKEYRATIVITVDDQLVDLCVNGKMVLPLGPNYGNWTRADTYTVVMESGANAVGVHGIDTGMVISAFMATITVNGQTYVTDGVMPPDDGIAYTPADPEWFATEWRYFPTVQEGPNADWCDKWFDDSGWGPGIRAGITGSTPIDKWGNLGAYPWTSTACGYPRCPGDFIPYYEDAIVGNEPMWIWDYNPTTLADAWLRRVIVLP
mgnify:CR=1 FL=1